VVIHAVTQCAYTCQHQQSWGSHTQPKRWTMETVHNKKTVWWISIFLGPVNTMINWCVLTLHQMSVFSGKTHNLQTWKYDVSMTSPVKNI